MEDILMTARNSLPQSVNFHLTKACNFTCKYCHSQFRDSKRSVTQEEAHKIVKLIAETPGTQQRKITLVGGEPTLVPWLPEIISEAKMQGLVTMVVTNGFRLLDNFYGEILCHNLDWVGFSIDSILRETNLKIGRTTHQTVLCENDWIGLAEYINVCGIKLKINTVVTRYNQNERLFPLIAQMMPERWKIMQVMSVQGQNDDHFEDLVVNLEAFNGFVERNRKGLENLPIQIAVEPENLMRGSYAMIDPKGRFFDSTAGCQTYSDPILDVGIERAWHQVSFSEEKFADRGGDYDFLLL
jgi:radical S-adenosyl methionine domain-containing protein 2